MSCIFIASRYVSILYGLGKFTNVKSVKKKILCYAREIWKNMLDFDLIPIMPQPCAYISALTVLSVASPSQWECCSSYLGHKYDPQWKLVKNNYTLVVRISTRSWLLKLWLSGKGKGWPERQTGENGWRPEEREKKEEGTEARETRWEGETWAAGCEVEARAGQQVHQGEGDEGLGTAVETRQQRHCH